MAAIKIGTSGLVQQPSTYSFSPSGGQIATHRYLGTQAEVESSYNSRISDETNEELQINTLPGGRAELVVTVPTGVQQSWELDIQWNDRLPGQSNKFRAFFDALTNDTTRATFISDCEELRAGTVPAGFSGQSATYQAWAWDIVYDNPVQEPTACLRRTITWPSGSSSTSVNWTDVNKVWTTAQITSLTDPPPAICGTLPSAYWLMLSDSAEYGADGRFTASTIWVSGTYPTHKYTYKT